MNAVSTIHENLQISMFSYIKVVLQLYKLRLNINTPYY